MTDRSALDPKLAVRLPLPLAQLYRRSYNAKSEIERHDAAFYMMEAAIRLLGSASVSTGEGPESEDEPGSRREALGRLARPTFGDWWRLVRAELSSRAGVTSEDLTTIDDLVSYGRAEMGHACAGQKPREHYATRGRELLATATDFLRRVDVLDGGRLVFVVDVRPRREGGFLIDRLDLAGEHPQLLPALTMEAMAPGEALPVPGHVEIERLAEGSPPQLIDLHPLLVFDSGADELFFLRARPGSERAEWLSYSTGRCLTRESHRHALRERVADLVGVPPESFDLEARERESAEDERARLPEGALEPRGRPFGELQLISELGRGGMGVVYRAWQPSLGREVAVKCLLHSGDARAEARFQREIRALARVEHPHLVKIYADGIDGNRFYYAMELIEGVSLSRVARGFLDSNSTRVSVGDWRDAIQSGWRETRDAERVLTPDPEATTSLGEELDMAAREITLHRGTRSHVAIVAELGRQVAEAAHALHEAGVVHRDIKPGNIAIGMDGTDAVLMDLGLARIEGAGGRESRLTRSRQTLGTPPYISPEQIHNVGEIDRRADVYSLGVTLWELLTLRPFFGPEALPEFEVLQRILSDEVPRPRRFNRSIPRDLEAIVLQCLEKKRERRYSTALEIAQDIERWRSGLPVHARPATVGYVLMKTIRRRWKVAVAMIVLMVSVAVTLIVGRVQDGRERERRAARHVAEGVEHMQLFGEIGERLSRERRELREMKDSLEANDDRQPLREKTRSIERGVRERANAWGSALHSFQSALEIEGQGYRAARLELGRAYVERALECEREGNFAEAASFNAEARRYDDEDGTLARILDKRTLVRLQTEPPGARIHLFEFVEHGWRLHPVPFDVEGGRRVGVEFETGDAEGGRKRRPVSSVYTRIDDHLDPGDLNDLGVTAPGSPIEARLPSGSYLLVVEAEGYESVRYPLLVDRGVLFQRPQSIVLKRAEEFPEPGPARWVWIPAGPSIIGGDPLALSGFARSVESVPGFFISRFETTVREYGAFLSLFPRRTNSAVTRQQFESYLPKEEIYTVGPQQIEVAEGWDSLQAIRGVHWSAAVDMGTTLTAYHESRGRAFELGLPTELEWERASRGADGRVFPWGNRFDWSFLCGNESLSGGRSRSVLVGSFLADESPFGVRDLAGGVREWTADLFSERRALRTLKGGSWGEPDERNYRLAYRLGRGEALKAVGIGFRMVARPKPIESEE